MESRDFIRDVHLKSYTCFHTFLLCTYLTTAAASLLTLHQKYFKSKPMDTLCLSNSFSCAKPNYEWPSVTHCNFWLLQKLCSEQLLARLECHENAICPGCSVGLCSFLNSSYRKACYTEIQNASKNKAGANYYFWSRGEEGENQT